MHRFFARHSFKAHDRLLIAATCVFLAGKVEETQVSLPDIIKYYFQATKETIPDKQKMADLKGRILVCLFFLYECMYVCLCVVDDASVLFHFCVGVYVYFGASFCRSASVSCCTPSRSSCPLCSRTLMLTGSRSPSSARTPRSKQIWLSRLRGPLWQRGPLFLLSSCLGLVVLLSLVLVNGTV